jgi:signal transduction histidine kinase
LKQLLINLLNNAIKACEKNGGNIEINLLQKDDQIILSITDSGDGIPDDIKEKIFTPYYTTREDGTGLGLSIVHQIVEENNGGIEIESPPKGKDRGTRFVIQFPV